MGCLCSSPPDLTEHYYQIADWEELFGSGSVWVGNANLHNEQTDYLEIKVISKHDNPLQGERVINIAESTTTESTRFEFDIEKIPKKQRQKDGPTHFVVFNWKDPSGLTLRGTILNLERKKITGLATFQTEDEGESYSGEFQLTRAMGPTQKKMISPRNASSQSTKRLIEKATNMANKKFEKEEFQRQSKIDTRAIKAAEASKEKFSDDVLSKSPRKKNGGDKYTRKREQSAV